MKTTKPLPTRRCRTCDGTGREPRVTGAQLRKLRLEAGIGLREMGRLTGLDDSLLSRAETGKGPTLNPGQLRIYLRHLGPVVPCQRIKGHDGVHTGGQGLGEWTTGTFKAKDAPPAAPEPEDAVGKGSWAKLDEALSGARCSLNTIADEAASLPQVGGAEATIREQAESALEDLDAAQDEAASLSRGFASAERWKALAGRLLEHVSEAGWCLEHLRFVHPNERLPENVARVDQAIGQGQHWLRESDGSAALSELTALRERVGEGDRLVEAVGVLAAVADRLPGMVPDHEGRLAVVAWAEQFLARPEVVRVAANLRSLRERAERAERRTELVAHAGNDQNKALLREADRDHDLLAEAP